jgi:hypothetical protein
VADGGKLKAYDGNSVSEVTPYIPKDVSIYGLLMDPNSGEIEVVI